MGKLRKKRQREISAQAAGWRITEYFPALTGFGGESTYYALPEEARPHHVRVGRNIVIIEPPAAYLSRLAKLSAKRPIQLNQERA